MFQKPENGDGIKITKKRKHRDKTSLALKQCQREKVLLVIFICLVNMGLKRFPVGHIY